mmetsp:Transcript_43326/g.97207  ORF Transcript_43326/g.97207 Transcript_43326/m.97207 type:complete len:299 (-) Transcript_43326:212-1108(-)
MTQTSCSAYRNIGPGRQVCPGMNLLSQSSELPQTGVVQQSPVCFPGRSTIAASGLAVKRCFRRSALKLASFFSRLLFKLPTKKMCGRQLALLTRSAACHGFIEPSMSWSFDISAKVMLLVLECATTEFVRMSGEEITTSQSWLQMTVCTNSAKRELPNPMICVPGGSFLKRSKLEFHTLVRLSMAAIRGELQDQLSLMVPHLRCPALSITASIAAHALAPPNLLGFQCSISILSAQLGVCHFKAAIRASSAGDGTGPVAPRMLWSVIVIVPRPWGIGMGGRVFAGKGIAQTPSSSSWV